MLRTRCTIRPAWNACVGLIAFSALSAMAFAAHEWNGAPIRAELCRLAIARSQGAARELARRSPELYNQRDLWLAEESLFERERARFETRAAVAADRVAIHPPPADSTDLLAETWPFMAGPDAWEDDYLWYGARDEIIPDTRLADLREMRASSLPAAPQSILAAAAPLALSGPAGAGLFAPALRSLTLRPPVSDRLLMVRFATPPVIFLLGYFSIRNGYAGRELWTLLSPAPLLAAACRALHPAPLSVIVPTTVTTSPEFLV